MLREVSSIKTILAKMRATLILSCKQLCASGAINYANGNYKSVSIQPFVLSANQVRGWERTLNRVNETLDMWYTVQRKWMYLESIFIGAEDIRLQLPEEAKKFDAIDKAFKQASSCQLKSAGEVEDAVRS